jgi:DNA-binding PadR family transcriptional regulator
VLKTLAGGARHGYYAIAREIQKASADMLQIEEGSLYPALYRMEARGWLKPEWRMSENHRRASTTG